MSVCRISSCISRLNIIPKGLERHRNFISSAFVQPKRKNSKREIFRAIPPSFECKQCSFSSPFILPKTYYNKNEELRLPHSHKRCIHVSRTDRSREDGSNEKQLPKLLYIQNPLVWFSNKLDFRFLRSNWDPHFSEAEFSRGARQAVSKITELVSMNRFDTLKNLLTKTALLSLRRDVEILWADEVRRNIALRPEDVQLVIPRKLYFRNLTNQRFCDIDMVFIGLKWLEQFHWKNPPLLFVDIFGRFHRNYTEGINPEWTVAAFRVRRFNVMPARNQR